MRPSVIVLDAALAALADVTLGGAAVCDKALAAADFDLAPVDSLRMTLDAFVEALAPVTLVAIDPSPCS